jgi:hypothetical protein
MPYKSFFIYNNNMENTLSNILTSIKSTVNIIIKSSTSIVKEIMTPPLAGNYNNILSEQLTREELLNQPLIQKN